MKNFLDYQLLHNTVYNWLISIGVIVLSIVIGKILYWFFGSIIKKITSKTKSRFDDILIDMIEEPIVLGFLLTGIWIGFSKLTFSQNIDIWLTKGFYLTLILNTTWLFARLLDAFIKDYFIPLTNKKENDLNSHLLPVLRKSLRSIIWIVGIIIALSNTGFDVGAIIAGLGIGGLALAMAAKDTVSNIFGGFTVFTDKPFKTKDRIKIGGFDGTVEEIGLRSTRLRTLEGRLVTIPNSKFGDSMVENVSIEPNRKVVLNLGLTYDTTPENIELAMNLLKDIASKNNNLEENVLLSFNNFGDFSLGILFIYYIKKEADILETQTQINLEILKQFNENKLEFAFPTQTIQVENT